MSINRSRIITNPKELFLFSQTSREIKKMTFNINKKMQIEIGLINLKCSRWVILFPIGSLGTGHSQRKILRVIGSIMWRAMQSLCSWWDTINGTYKASITWSFIVPHCFENSKSILQLYRISQTLESDQNE